MFSGFEAFFGGPLSVGILGNDAPGGIQEEWRELMYSLGFEYWYQNQFGLRAGYFHEHETKGNRKYFTLGAGLKMNVFTLDFAYLIPANQGVKSPLENTMRFSLIFDIAAPLFLQKLWLDMPSILF